MKVLTVAEPLTSVPIVYLWPHSNCNCRCVMCDIWKVRSRAEISAADVRRWIDEWQALGVRQVLLTGGEALMHSHLWELCDVLRGRDLEIVLLSTGITLAREAEHVARHVNAVNVSLDGPEAVHDDIRRIPGAFRRLAAGVARLRALRPDLPIVARSAIHRRNCSHLCGIVDSAHELGLSGVSFLAADLTSEAFNRPGGWSSDRAAEIALGPDELPLLERELSRLESHYGADLRSGFVREPGEVLRRRLLDYYRAHLGRAEFPEVTCNAPWVSAVVEYDGTVRPCFFQPAYGNVYEAGGLAAVLNSPAAERFRRELNVKTDPICRRCVCPLTVHRCDCGASQAGVYCDRTCQR